MHELRPTPFSGALRAAEYGETENPRSVLGELFGVEEEAEQPIESDPAEEVEASVPELAPADVILPMIPVAEYGRRRYSFGLPSEQPAEVTPERAAGIRGIIAKLTNRNATNDREAAAQARSKMLAEAEQFVRQATWHRAIGIMIANRKGGVGNTPVAIALGGTLASIRGGSVAVLETTDDAGTLALRSEGKASKGLGEFAQNTDRVKSAGQLADYGSLQTSHASVIGSPVPRAPLNGQAVIDMAKCIDVHHQIRIMDTGNVYSSGAFGASVHVSDVLVIPVTDSLDSLQDAFALMGHLKLTKRGEELLSAAIIVRLRYLDAAPATVQAVDAGIASMGIARVVDIPHDPHIAARGPITLAKLQPQTRAAFLVAAAAALSEITI